MGFENKFTPRQICFILYWITQLLLITWKFTNVFPTSVGWEYVLMPIWLPAFVIVVCFFLTCLGLIAAVCLMSMIYLIFGEV